MSDFKAIRWKQRFENLTKAFENLSEGMKLSTPSDLEVQGIIKAFEFSFELSWLTMKDYLESKGIVLKFPRDVIKEAFHSAIIENGAVWMQMMDDRNAVADAHNLYQFGKIHETIKTIYHHEIARLIDFFQKNEIDEFDSRLSKNIPYLAA